MGTHLNCIDLCFHKENQKKRHKNIASFDKFLADLFLKSTTNKGRCIFCNKFSKYF